MKNSSGSSNSQPSLVHSVFWSWLGLISTLLSGLILTPVLLKSAGPTQYGVWTLAFAFSEGAWFFDLGIRSATGHFVSRAYANQDIAELNRLLSTSLVFFGVVGALVITAAAVTAKFADWLFQIPAELLHMFVALLALATIGWAGTAVFVAFDCCLEGMSRFDLLTRVAIATALVRTLGSILILTQGGSLIAVAALTAATQIVASGASLVLMRRLVPELRVSPGAFCLETFRTLARYGGLAVAASLSARIICNAAPMILGHFQAPAAVAYFAVPMRIQQMLFLPVNRIAVVLRTRVSQLGVEGPSAHGRIVELVEIANRYSLILLLAVVVGLAPFATPILALFSTPEFAVNSTPVLYVMLIAAILGPGSQYPASSALFGMGEQRAYSLASLALACLGAALMAVVAPWRGVMGVTVVTGVLLVLSQGFGPSYFLTRVTGTSLLRFLVSVFGPPVVPALLVTALGFAIAGPVGAQGRWAPFAGAAGLGMLYLALAFAFSTRAQDRAWVFARLRRRS